jgi:hypothetical protein
LFNFPHPSFSLRGDWISVPEEVTESSDWSVQELGVPTGSATIRADATTALMGHLKIGLNQSLQNNLLVAAASADLLLTLMVELP